MSFVILPSLSYARDGRCHIYALKKIEQTDGYALYKCFRIQTSFVQFIYLKCDREYPFIGVVSLVTTKMDLHLGRFIT